MKKQASKFKNKNPKTNNRYFILKTINKNGITILELLFSLVLFTAISISLMRMTDKTIQYKKKVTNNMKAIKTSRNVVQIIKKDILNIFYTQDINALNYRNFFSAESGLSLTVTQRFNASKNESDRESSNRQTQEKVLKQNQQIYDGLMEFTETNVKPFIPNKVSFSGGIIGKEDSLHLVSLSYIQNQENEKKSDQNIVIYYLKDCKSRENNKEQSTCLWRKFSTRTNQDLEDPKDYSEFVLLERVKKFELYYYNGASKEWLKEWKTGNNQRRVLPAAIQVTIEYENKRKKTVKSLIHSALHQQFILPVQTKTSPPGR